MAKLLAGLAGLLQYAAYYVTMHMDNGTRHKIWILASLFNGFLNHCSRAWTAALPVLGARHSDSQKGLHT